MNDEQDVKIVFGKWTLTIAKVQWSQLPQVLRIMSSKIIEQGFKGVKERLEMKGYIVTVEKTEIVRLWL